jgi:hypothetical protein
MKHLPFFIVLAMIAGFITGVFCQRDKLKENFKAPGVYNYGEILYPSYACNDTMIVTNAEQLTEAMELIEGTDGEIDSIIHLYAAPYHINYGLQPINFEQVRN